MQRPRRHNRAGTERDRGYPADAVDDFIGFSSLRLQLIISGVPFPIASLLAQLGVSQGETFLRKLASAI